MTLSDPKTFKKQITVTSDMIPNPDTELLEYACTETPRERFHLVGRTEAEKKVHVAAEILEKYVGDYEFQNPNAFGIRIATVTRSGERVFIDFNGKGRTPLVGPVADDVLAALARHVQIRSGRSRNRDARAGARS